MNELISIIVPVYNVDKYLGICLDSLIRQTYKNIEIICVNDGSTDNSILVLKEYKKIDNRIKIIEQKNKGVSAARNTGLRNSNGAYIMFVDADDWVDDVICEKLYQIMKIHNVNISMCCYSKEYEDHNNITEIFDKDIVFDGDNFYSLFFARLAGIPNDFLRYPEKSDELISPCMQLFKKEIISGITFKDLAVIGTAEDWLFQLEAYAISKNVAYINKPYYHYRKTNETSITSKYKPNLYMKWINLYDNVITILKKYHLYNNYITHISNKIAISYLYLGLNEISSDESINRQVENLKIIRNIDRYEKAFSLLDLTKMKFPWNLFFCLCKEKKLYIVAVLLKLINYLRKHI